MNLIRLAIRNKQRKRKYFSDIFPNIKNSSQSNSPSSQSNSPSPKMYNPSTKKIQNYILKYFPNHKDLLGTKRPNDGLWGVKTDEAILRIIHDIEQKTKTSN